MDDLAYFQMRVRQEKDAAESAAAASARERHEELARAYELRCRTIREELRSSKERRVEEALQNQSF